MYQKLLQYSMPHDGKFLLILKVVSFNAFCKIGFKTMNSLSCCLSMNPCIVPSNLNDLTGWVLLVRCFSFIEFLYYILPYFLSHLIDVLCLLWAFFVWQYLFWSCCFQYPAFTFGFFLWVYIMHFGVLLIQYIFIETLQASYISVPIILKSGDFLLITF